MAPSVNRSFLLFFLPFWWEHILLRGTLAPDELEKEAKALLHQEPPPLSGPYTPLQSRRRQRRHRRTRRSLRLPPVTVLHPAPRSRACVDATAPLLQRPDPGPGGACLHKSVRFDAT